MVKLHLKCQQDEPISFSGLGVTIEKMVKLLLCVLLFAFFTLSNGRSIAPIHPHVLRSVKLKTNRKQAARSCPYTVVIKTSCSSPSYTGDQVSLAFGDVYGNEVYAKRLDDPYSGTFERCSADTFELNGPCTYDICYLYLLRRGSDGWKPESVKIYGRYTRAVTFYYNTFLPNGVWFGFDQCHGASLPTIM